MMVIPVKFTSSIEPEVLRTKDGMNTTISRDVFYPFDEFMNYVNNIYGMKYTRLDSNVLCASFGRLSDAGYVYVFVLYKGMYGFIFHDRLQPF